MIMANRTDIRIYIYIYTILLYRHDYMRVKANLFGRSTEKNI